MPRSMSFMLTTRQILAETKTETRRLGWSDLQPGELFWAVEKCMGLKKGSKHNVLKLLRCRKNIREELESIDASAVRREGFPGMTPADFVDMFCKHNGCDPTALVSVISFGYCDRETTDREMAIRSSSSNRGRPRSSVDQAARR